MTMSKLRNTVAAIAALALTTSLAVSVVAQDEPAEEGIVGVYSIEGVTWLLTGQAIDGEMVPVPDRLAVSLQMEDGQAGGNGGCNGYFGSFSTNNNEITISSLGATSQFCPEPEGVMEQEAAFLMTLPSATRFRLDGNTLELRNSGDQMVAIMNGAP